MRVTFVTCLVALFLLPACGGSDKPETDFDLAFVNAELAALELRIAEEILDGGDDGVSDLPQVTGYYVEALREHGPGLGRDEVERRLIDAAAQVARWCPPCERMLDRELARLRA